MLINFKKVCTIVRPRARLDATFKMKIDFKISNRLSFFLHNKVETGIVISSTKSSALISGAYSSSVNIISRYLHYLIDTKHTFRSIF